jgi:hypothetical protein
MSSSPKQNLTSLVNASGFLFQLGLEHQITSTTDRHHWTIVSHEHPWSYGEYNGFIDIVFQKGFALAVVECKRSRDGTWVFLVPEKQSSDISRLRCLWVAGRKDGASFAGWDDLNCLPRSYESEFCVVRGSGEGDRPLLERLCAVLLTSIDGLAEEELSILRKEPREYEGFYLPLIVTTAELQVCRFRPDDVDMTTGEVNNAVFESVPFMRFRKAFSTEQPPNAAPKDLAEAAVGRERSVIVVNATNVVSLLTKLTEEEFSPRPWLTVLQGQGNAGKIRD